MSTVKLCPHPPQSSPGAEIPLGLRERKKIRTRVAIQAHALELIRRQGYDATTVQQIAAAAEVSESTFFRYFPTKADVVMWDEFDPLIIDAFRRQPGELTAIGAIRRAIAEVFASTSAAQADDQRMRTALAVGVPELRAVMLDQLVDAMALLAGLFAERTGGDPESLELRTAAGAVVGAAMAAMFVLAGDPEADMAAVLDDALGQLERGLGL